MSRKNTGSLSCLSTIESFTKREISLPRPSQDYSWGEGVNITITNISKNYWIPGLRQLTKKVISKYHGCKRFQSKPFTTPIPEYLPKNHSEQNLPFKVIGADYAGPIYCKTKSKSEVKVYILLFTWSISRAIQLEISSNQTTDGGDNI